jgi:predicted small metal-binding protein
MREFKCSSLGYDCSWKHIEREELLADMVALHLRDVHGVQALDNEMVGKIKNLYTFPTKEDAAEAADLVMREYNCDMGPECTWRYVAMSESLISEGAEKHAREKHGVKDFTQELRDKVMASIRKWTGEKKKKAA